MTFSRARLLQLFVDGLIVFFALALAYGMRFEGLPPRHYLKQFLLIAPYFVLLRMGLMMAFGVYRLIWRYIGMRDLPRLVGALCVGTCAMLLVRVGLPGMLRGLGLVFNPTFFTVPYSVLFIELVLAIGSVIAIRLIWRVLMERAAARGPRPTAAEPPDRRRAILIGAGAAGVLVAREVAQHRNSGFEIVGFVDDDVNKYGTIIQGQRVFGPTSELALYAEQHEAEVAIITIANAPAATMRRLVKLAEQSGLKVKIIPGLQEILSGRVNISKVRDVAIEDLLGRNPVELEMDNIRRFLDGKVVLVTGAGGSIGSEMCRQICRFNPSKLLILDQAENPIFHLLRELAQYQDRLEIVPLIGSVTEREQMRQVFADHHTDVVFHAAAHKHVPLMECNPREAIRNNVLGSRNIADLAHDFGVKAFVMISTDKAVNPTSVMGATKRLAEMYIQSLADRSRTRFITVRFGNVLGSQGSVVPLFQEQILRGGPVTITHPEMRRYFMTIPEASQLVLQAATMGEGGEIFILEMGEPVKIVNLARDLIHLSGYRPDDDIEIAFIGVRPGEKLYEEINLTAENANKTRHPRIWVGRYQQLDHHAAAASVADILARVQTASHRALIERLATHVPEYKPDVGESDASASHSGSENKTMPVAV